MRLRYLAPLAMAAAAAAIGLAPPGPHRRGRAVSAPAPATRPCASGPATLVSSTRRRWFPARCTRSSHIRWAPCSSGTADSASVLRSRSSAATSTASVIAVVE